MAPLSAELRDCELSGSLLVGKFGGRFGGKGVWNEFRGKKRVCTFPIQSPPANRQLADQLDENRSRDEMEVGRTGGVEEWLGEIPVFGRSWCEVRERRFWE